MSMGCGSGNPWPNRKGVDEWGHFIMRLFFLCCPLLFLLSGCFGIRKIPSVPDIPCPPSDVSLFEQIAYYGSGLAGVAVLIGIVLLWTNPKRGQQLIAIALSVLIGSQIMIWVGAHLIFISIITLIGSLIYVSYRHREQIEDIFDQETERMTKEREHG